MDFNTTESLYLPAGESDTSHIETMGLTLAQKLVLLEFASKDTATKDIPANKKDGMPQSMCLDAVLDGLQLSSADGQYRMTNDAEQKRLESSLGALDSQIYLRGGSPAKKFLSIIDFLKLVPPVSDEQVVSEDDGIQMVLRLTSQKPKLQNVAIEEWTMANMNIIDALMAEGVLFATGVRDYMSHTIKILKFLAAMIGHLFFSTTRSTDISSPYTDTYGGLPLLKTVHLRVNQEFTQQ